MSARETFFQESLPAHLPRHSSVQHKAGPPAGEDAKKSLTQCKNHLRNSHSRTVMITLIKIIVVMGI